jgi:hypothetical protein
MKVQKIGLFQKMTNTLVYNFLRHSNRTKYFVNMKVLDFFLEYLNFYQ